MLGGTKHQDVKGGRIRSVCPRCKKISYVAVSSNLRQKAVRCKCGKTVYYKLNFRGYHRESISGPAELVINRTTKFKVFLNDISSAGIGFFMQTGSGQMVKTGREANLKYRTASGSHLQRKIRIRNRGGTKVGAEFIDSLAALAKRTI